MRISDNVKSACHRICENKYFVILSTTVTLYCLFGLEVRNISFTIDSTGTFDALTIFSLVFFTIEIILASIGNEGYWMSFFFILDIVATSTLVLDISTVSSTFLSGTLSKASSASRAGTQATRVIRIIRLIRLFRISKLFKTMTAKQQKEGGVDEFEDDDLLDDPKAENSDDTPYESDVGNKLSKMTSQRVVIIVLLLMFVTPEFSTSAQYTTAVDVYSVGIDNIHRSYGVMVASLQSPSSSTVQTKARSEYESRVLSLMNYGCNDAENCQQGIQTKIAWIGASVNDNTFADPSLHMASDQFTVSLPGLYQSWTDLCDRSLLSASGVRLMSSCPSSLWPTDITLITSKGLDNDGFWFELVIDKSEYSKSEALLSVYRMLAICAILAVGTYVFSQGAFVLVLEPIQRMMEKVEKIRQNPLMAARIDDHSHKKNEVEKLRRLARYNTATNPFSRWLAKRKLAELSSSSLETAMLEKTIVRIGGLLALGFGQAGAEIVAQNMTSTASGINAMVPGKRVDAIFAFIRIVDFSILTSVLKDKIMLFVNQICDIVHGIADEFHGAANRSNGDSFLIIWRLSGLSPEKVCQMHDMAAAACAKIFVAIRRSIELNEYRHLPPLMQRIPNFRVKLSFGLHRGWAIEGAIGSSLKIDPSYIGPDVNLAETLESLNPQYGTNICLSQSVAESCTRNMLAMFRHVDTVQLDSARVHMRIYCFDIDDEAELLTQYEIDNVVLSQPTAHAVGDGLSRFRRRMDRERRKEDKWNTSIPTYLSRDSQFLRLRRLFDRDPIFTQKFRNGFLNYETGEWENARGALEETREMLLRFSPEENDEGVLSVIGTCLDGPSEALLKYMKGFNYIAPPDWRGVHRIQVKTENVL